MRCPACETENPQQARFCMNCGARLLLVCPECGTELPWGAKFCLECGAAVRPRAAVPTPTRGAVAERLRRLVPKEFAERLLATRGHVQAERRKVTILFSRVRGSTARRGRLDPEDVIEITDGVLDVLIQPIVRYEGTVARLMADGVLAFFGAPIAHEDDPERAVRAALEITEGAEQYAAARKRERGIEGFSVGAGIHTGPVVVGEVALDLRVAYRPRGNTINLAAQMEQRAPSGGILITHETYRHVRGVFDVVSQEPLEARGEEVPIQTYLVQRVKPRAFRKGVRGVGGIETRMVGRRAEFSCLKEASYAALKDRELQLVTIVGDAGVGKSRLLDEFENWAELLPETFYFFKGGAPRVRKAPPFGVIRSLFAFRFRIRHSDSVTVVREKLERGMGAALGDGAETRMRAHFLGRLAGFELGTSPHLEGSLNAPKEFRDRALTYLAEYFAALASDSPVLILLEDLHRADDSSLAALHHLTLALMDRPLIIACTARPTLLERRPNWGKGQSFHRRIRLQPLDRRDTRRLLTEILQKVDEVPEALSQLVVAGSEGNPLFVEELVKLLVEDGVIVRGVDRWQIEQSRVRELRVPLRVADVLQSRLERLPLEDRSVLEQASAIGPVFWDQAVQCLSDAAAQDVGDSEVLTRLSALREGELVFQEETTAFVGSREYAFKHDLVHDVVYSGLSKQLKRLYHGLAADWLIGQTGERAVECSGLIADHLELAGDRAEAVEWLLRAGDRARAVCAYREGIDAFGQALSVLREVGDDVRAARTVRKLAEAYQASSDSRADRQFYDEDLVITRRAQEEALVPPTAAHVLRLSGLDPQTLDPGMSFQADPGYIIDQLFHGLVELTPQLDVAPCIARTWRVSEDGCRYVFHLRNDISWSDGAPLTARDFEYAWKRVLDPAIGSPNGELLYAVKGARALHQGRISDPDQVGVRAVGDGVLVVDLEGPTGYFLHLLAHHTTFAVPQHVVETHGAAWTQGGNIVTSGPFTVERWDRGASLVLVRHPGYRGKASGNVQRVELSVLRDPSARLGMFEDGVLDVLHLRGAPSPATYHAQQRHRSDRMALPRLSTRYVGFGVTRRPFDDVRVRRAFILAVDKEELAEVLMRGDPVAAGGGFVPPGLPGHAPGIGPAYDPGRARQLLVEAGYPGGRGFPRVDAVIGSASAALGEFLRSQWLSNLYIDVTWETVRFAGLCDRLHAGEPPHVYVCTWAADYPDPDNFLRAGHIQVHSRWRDERYEQLVEEARHLLDQKQRMALYQQAERILAEQAVVAPLYYPRYHLLVKPWVKRYPGPMKNVVVERD